MPSHLSLKSGCTDLLKASRGTGGCAHSRPNSQVTAVCVVPHSMLHLLPQLFVEQLRGTVLPLSGGLNEKHSPRGSYAWTLGPQLALLFGRVLEPLEGAALLEEKCWMPALRVWNLAHFLFSLSLSFSPCFPCADEMWALSFLLLLPHPTCQDGLNPSGIGTKWTLLP